MKILLIQHLNFINGSGGTEKICSFLANNFTLSGNTVEIATNQDITGKSMFALHKSVKVTNIFNPDTLQKCPLPIYNYQGKNPFLWLKFKVKKKKTELYNKKFYTKIGGKDGLFKFNLSQRSRNWKTYIDELNPDLIITMSIGSLLEITYNNTYKFPIINSTNGRPDYDYTDILWYRSSIEMELLRHSYRHLTAIQVLFESYKAFLPETFKGKQISISNPVPQFSEEELVNHNISKEKYKIINIAALATDCKQQHIAIDVFANLCKKFKNWELHFWGVGNDLKFLNEKIQNLNLQDKIFLNGFTDNPISKLKESDIFLFPSKYEGFPLALTEAMSVGLPCIGFKTCSGVNELIKHNENGFLAEDRDELTIYLQRLMEDVKLRNDLGKNAHKAMIQFAPEKIQANWNLLLKSII